MTQTQFWAQYGVTQSTGSRYENVNRKISRPVKMLIALETGMASMEDLITGKLVGIVS